MHGEYSVDHRICRVDNIPVTCVEVVDTCTVLHAVVVEREIVVVAVIVQMQITNAMEQRILNCRGMSAEYCTFPPINVRRKVSFALLNAVDIRTSNERRTPAPTGACAAGFAWLSR
jgi:hypothetical protein